MRAFMEALRVALVNSDVRVGDTTARPTARPRRLPPLAAPAFCALLGREGEIDPASDWRACVDAALRVEAWRPSHLTPTG
jgi:hypothetical protein